MSRNKIDGTAARIQTSRDKPIVLDPVPPPFPAPVDKGCECGGGGICAPQHMLTHAEYAQVIKARVTVHRLIADDRARRIQFETEARQTALELANRPRTLPPVGSSVETVAPLPPPPKDPPRDPVVVSPAFDPAKAHDRLFRPAAIPKSPPRAADTNELACWNTGPYKLDAPRKVRRYAAWYAGKTCYDDRVVGAGAKHTKEWRMVAKRDADAVVRAIEEKIRPGWKRVEMCVDRRGGGPESDRIQRADALCWYTDDDGEVQRAQAAYCVSLVDDNGKTQVGLIYLPMGQ